MSTRLATTSGFLGVADDEVADLLGAKADPVERVGGAHPALVELVVDDVAGDGSAARSRR